MSRKIFYIFSLFVLLPAMLVWGAGGRIKGKVTDKSTGEPLVAANVIIVGTSFGAATDANGEFIILNLQPGVYTVKASYLGYHSLTIKNVRVSEGLTTDLNFQLTPQNISVQTVTVTAKRELIKKDATTAIRDVSSEDIKNLPVRGVQTILTLQPGVIQYNDGIHLRGSRRTDVGYYLEGISISDPETGLRNVTISNDAVEELQVEAGGYTAEYGGSNAGIIRTQLKTGGNQLHSSLEFITDNISFQSKSDFLNQTKRLGTYWYGNNETSFSLSGPLFNNKVKFFYNLDYKYDRSRAKKGYPGIDIGPVKTDYNTNPIYNDSINLVYPQGVRKNQQQQYYTHSATLSFDLNPIKLRLAGTYTSGWSQLGASGITQFLRNRYGLNEFSNGTFTVKLTHVLSKVAYYQAIAGFYFAQSDVGDQYLKDNYWAYGDSVANAKAGAVWHRLPREMDQWTQKGVTAEERRYYQPTSLDIYGFRFAQPNSIPVNHSKSERIGYSGRLDFTYNPNKHNYLKLGGEFKYYVSRFWGVGSQSGFAKELYQAEQEFKTNNGKDPSAKDILQMKRDILIRHGVDNYGYDVYGNKSDNGFDAPHKPLDVGAYIQDRLEYNDIILNVGLRYDYFDMDNLMFKDPTKPELALGTVWTDGNLIEKGFVKVPTYSYVSPRLSVSFPVTDRTVFYAGYGKYVQKPPLQEAYLGYHALAYQLGQSFFFANPSGANLQPIRKTHYEVGFRQQITDFLAFDITGYYDDIKGQIFFDIQDTDPNSPYHSYNIKANGDFSTTKGLELQLNMRRFHRIMGQASITFQDAEGTGSFPNSNAGIVGAPVEGQVFRPQYVSPLTYNKPFYGTVFLDYRFGPNDGPSLLHEFGVSVLATFSSGHPFTRGIGGANIESDARFRTAIEPLNSSLTPSTFNVDLKIDKTFRIMDKLGLNVYVRVLNLFDIRNVENVYIRTGAADDDGYISDPALGGRLVETYGEIYKKLYKSIGLDYNGFYSDARQILFGIRFEY